MNYFVGIDIAKYDHYATVLDVNGHIIVEPFTFTNDISGFNYLLSVLDNINKDEIIFGTESTAHYAHNLNEFLTTHGFLLKVINPIQTSKLRSLNIRNAKNDSIDCVVVARALLNGFGRLHSTNNDIYIDIKNLTRMKHNLTSDISKLKIQLSAQVDLTFPELHTFFKSGIHSKSCYALLSKYPSASLIANAHLTTITNILDSNSRGRFKKEHARNLKELAKQSVNCKLRTAVNINIKHIIENINLLKSQLDDVEQLITELLYPLDSTITSIPGMGDFSAASIIAEIGDINQFSSPSKLVAFAGLDPKVIQSGTFIASSTRMSKRGSKYLRHSLIFSAFNVSLNDPTFSAYYNKKRSEGKSHYCALGHVAKKLLHLLYKLMTTNTLFISNYEGKF